MALHHANARSEPQSASTVRLAWIDTARGLAIVLVVLVHATQWLQETAIGSTRWDPVNELATTLRMPLFFVCSGILAAKWLRAPWSALLSSRVLLLGWVYLLWQLVGTGQALVAARITGDHLTPFRIAVSLALSPIRPRFELWFIWALAIFLVLARLGARRPVATQLAVAATLGVFTFSGLVPDFNQGWKGVLSYYLFFLIGCHGRTQLLALAERLGGHRNRADPAAEPPGGNRAQTVSPVTKPTIRSASEPTPQCGPGSVFRGVSGSAFSGVPEPAPRPGTERVLRSGTEPAVRLGTAPALGRRPEPAVRSVAESVLEAVTGSTARCAAVAGGWLLLAALAQGTGALDWPGVGLAIRLAGVVAGISLALLLQNVKVFAYLGSRTLPIYLAHTPLIVLMVFAIDPLVTSSALQHVKWALPIVLTAVAVALALLVQRLALKSPLRILYAPPPTVTAALNGRLSRPRRTVAGRVRPGLRAGPAEP